MKRSNIWFASILIASALFLSGASTRSADLKQRRNQTHQAEACQDQAEAKNHQIISPTFEIGILSGLRALVSEEMAETKQQHTDHNAWNTKTFWIDFALNAALVFVGVAYTIVAYCQLRIIRDQSGTLKSTADAALKQANLAWRSFEMTLAGKIEIDATQISIDKSTLKIYFTVLNVGHRAVTIKKQAFGLWRKTIGNPWPIEFIIDETKSPKPLPNIFEAHSRVSERIEGTMDVFVGVGLNATDAFKEGRLIICLASYVAYSDHLDDTREIYSAMAWDWAKSKFVIPSDMPSIYNRTT